MYMKAILKSTPSFNPFIPIDLTEKKRLLEKLINILNSSHYEEDVKNVMFNSYFSKLLYLVRKERVPKNSNIGIQTLPENNHAKNQTKFFNEIDTQTIEEELPLLEEIPQDLRYKKAKKGFTPPGVPTSPAYQERGHKTPYLGAIPRTSTTRSAPKITLNTQSPDPSPKKIEKPRKKQGVVRNIMKDLPGASPQTSKRNLRSDSVKDNAKEYTEATNRLPNPTKRTNKNTTKK